ncbi:MAG: flagellar basal body L-ring protein FlgH, partial [Nitrospinaceae bacterium]|nr:flagellar basal body L-ring protein FlgH [Nitrospinaceae bacterium]
ETEPERHEGAIWSGDTSSNLLFVDAKARRVGDIVTVIVEEDATSAQKASTDTSKESNIDFETEG